MAATATAGSPVDVLMIGTGEYTTGYVNGQESDSDKGPGVVALSLFDMRRLGLVKRLGLCGVTGKKFPGIRNHMQKAIGERYKNMDLTVETFPEENEIDAEAYLKALDAFKPGDAVIVFTPDDTHYSIAKAAIQRKMHVLVTKPFVKMLQEHRELLEMAKVNNVLVGIEVHKRWDPIYADARDKIRGLGDFSFFSSYMSQPKHQLETFRAWAGKSSDISYYLNSHHVDFHEWCADGRSYPVSVAALASRGVASSKSPPIETEDTITLTVMWQNASGSTGHALYTSSWIAPRADVHSQQRFFYMGHLGEVTVDQAHRGYSTATDGDGYKSVNPLFMKYTPTDGFFSGQSGYGYKSIENFVKAASAVREKKAIPADFDHALATIGTTLLTTAILEAGRRSLDASGAAVKIDYEESDTGIKIPSGFSIDGAVV